MVMVTINGSFDHETINAALFPEAQDGTATSFRIDGGTGNDTIYAWYTPDILLGGKGEDRIFAGGGDDYVSAGNHDDFVDAGTGNDLVYGGAGNDVLHGNKGNDTIYGGSGNDMIYGTKGANSLFGGTGDDMINSGLHRSILDGGSGNDRLVADMRKGGDHVLTGGADADTFEFVGAAYSKTSLLTITDFELGIDSFSVDGTSVDQVFADYISGAYVPPANFLTDTGDGLLIRFDGGDTLMLEQIAEADFTDHYLATA